jgi:benzoylformate decarboxylase
VSTTGAQVVLDVLRSEQVSHIFGVPGSTELPLLDALVGVSDLRYVLGLHESVLIAMADGYAQASHRPAFVNVHTMSGLGNAMGALTNARANGTPLVVTAGQQDQRFLIADPLLSFDLAAMARPVSKWAHEVRSIDELGVMLRRAFRDAASPPSGPVFLSLPISVLEEEGDPPIPAVSSVALRTVPDRLDELADRLAAVPVGGLAMILGQEVAHSGAIPAARSVAEDLGARVYGAASSPVGVFPPGHPLWTGWLPSTADAVRATLNQYDAALFIGGQAFLFNRYTVGPPIPEGLDLYHISPDPLELGRMYRLALGLLGDPEATLSSLHSLLSTRVDAAETARRLSAVETRRAETIKAEEERARELYGPAPMHPMAAIHALLRSMPADTVVVDEAVSNGSFVRAFHRWEEPDKMYSGKQIIGWGLGAGIGISLAHDRNVPVLCISGDGSAMFGAQALWTAAHERIPLIYAVLVNRGYDILKGRLFDMKGRAAEIGEAVGVDIDAPEIDFVALAASMGVEATLIEHTDQIGERVTDGLGSASTAVIVIPVTRGSISRL